ncbi:hypothetical protein D9M73_110700 [compost metagenome]
MPLPWYDQTEIDGMCEPLTQHAAQIKYLKSLGLTVERKPGGKPLLMRAHAEQVLGGMPNAPAAIKSVVGERNRPDMTGLVLQFQRRGG